MITDFTVYDEITGQIFFSGAASDITVLAAPGQLVLEGRKLEGGWIDLNTMEHRLPNPKPSINHTFDFVTKQWVDARTNQQKSEMIRQLRDTRLKNTDWTQLPDVPVANQTAWAAYRQALRDITLQPGYPESVNWPTKPSNI